MDICDVRRAEKRPAGASVGASCRGFAGVFRLGAPDAASSQATDADVFQHARPTLALSTGPSSLRIQSADARRTLVVTGGARHGAALARATEVVESRLDPTALLELHGGLGCAFALHDAIHGTLVLGRDGIGVMPLYVAVHADRIAFATEMGSFASLLNDAPGLDASALAVYLDYGFNGGRHTALRGIERVRPGELIRMGRGLQVKRQRRPSVIGVERCNGLGFTSASSIFDALFEPTVASLVDAHQPSSLLLSGGLDSALICSALTRASKGPVNTLAVAYDFTRERDELVDAKRIAVLCGTRHTEVRLSREALWRHIPWTVWRTDELMDDPASLPTSLVSGQFAPDSAVFTGEGADDVFAGDGRYRRKAFQRFLADAIAPGSGGWRTHGLWGGRQGAATFGRRLVEASASSREDFIADWGALPDELSWLQRAQCFELATVFPNTQALKIGRNLDDAKASVRMPFLDPAIVRFGLALDDRLKVRGRVGKVFLREWACARLPHDHVMKRKRGFHVPIGHLLSGEYLDRLEPVLMASTLVSAWFKPAGVAQLFAAQRATGKCTDALWRLLYLAIWHTLFVLRPGSRPTKNEDPLAWIV